MYCLSDQQLDFILEDIRQHGIKIESLQQSLLDHICIMIEQGLEEGGDFATFYADIIPSFYTHELREIEEETLFLLAAKNRLVFSRNQFFLLLFTVILTPYVAYDLVWMLSESQANGWTLPERVWQGTAIFALFPLLVMLVLLLTPERFDPLIPRRSIILLGIHPLIKIVPHIPPVNEAIPA